MSTKTKQCTRPVAPAFPDSDNCLMEQTFLSVLVTREGSFVWLSVTSLFTPSLYCPLGWRSLHVVNAVGRTIPSWRIVVEQEIAVMSRFKQFLRPEDRAVFDDLVTQCKVYAAGGEVFTSPERKMSLRFWMIFAQHRKLAELEKRLNETPRSLLQEKSCP